MKITGSNLAKIPWQDRPVGSCEPVWRHDKNPIIHRHQLKTSNSIFNSAVVPFKSKFAGVFRCDDRCREMRLHAGFSDDGVAWNIEPNEIRWHINEPEIEYPKYGYDPRVLWFDEDQTFYITWCNGFHGPAIGIGKTQDFKTFEMIENALMPYNRNGVMFPRKIGGKYMILSRPSDQGHTAFGEIFISSSNDLIHWGQHRWVMKPQQPWESTKIGAGPVPIETDEGWLLIYHGVLTSCNGYVYHFGAVLLDLEQPWKVIKRCQPYLMGPVESYELMGDVPNVVFPCAALTDSATGKMAIYYGAADTHTCLAYTQIDILMEFIYASTATD